MAGVHTKLGPSNGPDIKLNVHDVVEILKRVWSSKADRRAVRPLRGLDNWSDQAEVAFYEESRGIRA